MKLSLRSRAAVWFVALSAGLLGAGAAALQARVRAVREQALDHALCQRAQTLAAVVDVDEGEVGVDWSRGASPVESGTFLAYEVVSWPERTHVARSGALGAGAIPLDAADLPPAPAAWPGHAWFPQEVGHRDLTVPAGARTLRAHAALFVLPDLEALYDDEELAGTVPAADDDDRERVLIVVAQDLAPLEADLAAQRAAVLGLAPFVFAAAVLAGAFLAQRVAAPLRAMTDAAARVDALGPGAPPSIPGSGAGDEVDALAGALEASFRRLREAVEREARFTADASHELRTPLSVVLTEAEVALRGTRTPDEYRAALRGVVEAAGRMRDTLEGLLILARADARTLEPEAEPVQLAPLVAEAWGPLEADAAAKGLALTVDAQDDLEVVGDARLVRVLLANLLQNAVRYSERPGVVAVRARRDGATATIEVADDGIGIGPEHLPHVFERFYRADPSRTRRAGGSGLGLSIVQAIAQAHGGAATIASAPGRGATVTVTLRAPA